MKLHQIVSVFFSFFKLSILPSCILKGSKLSSASACCNERKRPERLQQRETVQSVTPRSLASSYLWRNPSSDNLLTPEEPESKNRSTDRRRSGDQILADVPKMAATVLKVGKCPTDDLAFSNCAIANPTDLPDHIRHIAIRPAPGTSRF